MKTTKQVIEDSGIDATLIRAVVKTVGRDYLEDLANHGAVNGFPGITYYSDTLRFYKKHKKAILALAEQQAEDFGEDTLTMIASFNCLKDLKITPYRVARGLDGRGEDVTDIQNAMCWYACEEVARAFEE